MMTEKETPKEQKKQPLKCWLVEITLTSGEGLQFYVTAKNEIEAYRKADDYGNLVENKTLLNCYNGKGFTLLP